VIQKCVDDFFFFSEHKQCSLLSAVSIFVETECYSGFI